MDRLRDGRFILVGGGDTPEIYTPAGQADHPSDATRLARSPAVWALVVIILAVALGIFSRRVLRRPAQTDA